MATVRTRKGKKGQTYSVQVRLSGVSRSATFDTKSEAYRWAEETEQAIIDGKPLPGDLAGPSDMTLVDAVRRYVMAVRDRKKGTTRKADEEISGRLVHHFAGKTLRSIVPADIAAYRDLRLRSVGPSQVIQDMSMIACMYRLARLEWGLDGLENPEKDVRRPRPPKERMRLLDHGEIARLLDACGKSRQKNLFDLVLLLLHTGMRPAEAAGLRWDQVHLDQRIIDLTVTKTEPRRVPLTETAAGTLARREKSGVMVFLPDSQQGRLLPAKHFRHAFETACKTAGLHGVSLYTLRHATASHLLMAGVDIRTVAEILGHKNISMTMRYTHFMDAARLAAVDRLAF